MFNEDTERPPDVNESPRLSSVDRNMSVTPIDMRQREFGTAMRGFDRGEVTSFLVEAAGEYELALRENDRLRQEIVRLEASLHQFRELEGSLKSTLMSAQKVADDMRENAVKESQRLVREAEAQAEVLVQNAQGKIDAAQRDVDGLWLKRREAETGIEATISVLQSTLEFMRERERRGRDSNVIPHRPNVAQTA
jgi:cell division initiation protein